MEEHADIITALHWGTGKVLDVAIELDGRPWATLDAELVIQERLGIGDHLDDGRRAKLLEENLRRQGWRRLRVYLSGRRRSRLQVIAYLRRGKPSIVGSLAQELVERATFEQLVDDAAFAGAYVRTKRGSQTIGPRRLMAGLMASGVEPELAKEAIDADRQTDRRRALARRGKALPDPDTDPRGHAIQEAECRELLQRRSSRLQREENPRKRQEKALRFLLSRGYEMPPAVSAVQDLLKGLSRGDDALAAGDLGDDA